jgi:tRNA1(Val) A37 N6-methylase TrmN6
MTGDMTGDMTGNTTGDTAGIFAPDQTREDRLMGGRVRLVQPLQGYRAATDPVFLAAAVGARAGETVLDLGCGAGAALFCLAARVPGLELHGLEVQADYLALARVNAALNGVAAHLHEGDVAAPPQALKALGFDHVMMNPPYYAADFTGSPLPGRDRAHREARVGEAAWKKCVSGIMRPRRARCFPCRPLRPRRQCRSR